MSLPRMVTTTIDSALDLLLIVQCQPTVSPSLTLLEHHNKSHIPTRVSVTMEALASSQTTLVMVTTGQLLRSTPRTAGSSDSSSPLLEPEAV